MQTKQINIIKRITSVTILSLVIVMLNSRCAQIAMPMGGPTDSLPPRVLSMSPEFGKTNFSDKRITITFDEYVVLRDQQKEFYTSPAMTKLPLLTIRDKSLQIDFQVPLDSNQTYALNFGNTIADNNENNPLSGFRYVFSTGKTIDSLIMSGYTANAQSGDSVGNVFICFYDDATADSLMRIIPSDTMKIDSLVADSLARIAALVVDSVVVDTLPDYDSVLHKVRADVISRSRTNGIFIAENLAPKNYRVYAFEDKNGNKMYDPGVDMVGFMDSVYNPLKLEPFSMWFDTIRRNLQADPQIYVRMFQEKVVNPRSNFASIKRPEQQRLYMTFTGPNPKIESFVLDSIPSDSIITEYLSEGKDTMSLWLNKLPQNIPDSLYGHMIYLKYDSVGVLRPDTVKIAVGWRDPDAKRKQKEAEQREKDRERGKKVEEEKPPVLEVGAQLNGGKVIPEEHIALTFKKPLTEVWTNKMELYRHSMENDSIKELVPLAFEQDSVDMKKWWLWTQWQRDEKYSLMIPKGALKDISGLTNDTLKATFSMDSPDKYSTFILNIQAEDPQREYVVQILNGNGSVIKERKHVKQGTLKIEFIQPGETRIRVIDDKNGNGEWDSGDLRLRRQPEQIAYYSASDGNEIITAKLNWELEFDIDMRKLFVPMTMERMMSELKRKEIENQKRRDEERRKREQQGHSH